MTGDLSIYEICVRMLLAVIFSGFIGFDREFKNRPAGIRTHILVCIGAAIIAMIQKEITHTALEIARNNPDFAGVIRADEARLIAQVVSGIGFLGAGTIVVTKQVVRGLTTAASLWTVAGLGLAIGMGNYRIAIVGFIGIMLVLTVLKRVINVPSLKRIEISFMHKTTTKEFIAGYFKEKDIEVKDVDFEVKKQGDNRVYTNIYTVELPRSLSYQTVVEDLSMHENMVRVQLISV
ncbi:MgtC/SapB family protein [Tetragenococcus solitarius]|uniref:MgtC/SapB family protein n=1 Tax=Tetragenococcus solitarius TaxID=71453 RepID=A0ABP6KPF3_9ENTE|nr:MgtC/SapB family protein [Tetragenococcus solitarius]